MGIRIIGEEALHRALEQTTGTLKKGVEGEVRALEWLKQHLPPSSIIWVQPVLLDARPDFLIYLEQQQLFVILEVKNWTIQTYDQLRSNGQFVKTNRWSNNPLSQVKGHQEKLNIHFVNNDRTNIFWNIVPIVYFPNQTIDSFRHHFHQSIATWDPVTERKLFQHYLFDDTLSIWWQRVLPSYTNDRAAKRFRLTEKMIRSLDAQSYMQAPQSMQDFLTLKRLQPLMSELYALHPAFASDFQLRLQQIFEKQERYLKTYTSIEEALHHLDALKAELQLEQFRSVQLIHQLNEHLLETQHHLLALDQQYEKNVTRCIQSFFSEQRHTMIQKLRNDSSIATSLKDTGQKLKTPFTKLAHVAKEKTKKSAKWLDSLSEHDTQTTVEQLLSTYLNETVVEQTIQAIIESENEQYEKAWLQFSMRYETKLKEKLKQTMQYESSSAEKVFHYTMGAAVAGTVGLAAGWHTLAYSAANVFPPIALFGVAASATVLFAQQSKERDRRIAQVERGVTLVETHVFHELHMNQKWFQQVREQSQQRLLATKEHHIRMELGGLQPETYESIIQTFDALLQDMERIRLDVQKGNA